MSQARVLTKPNRLDKDTVIPLGLAISIIMVAVSGSWQVSEINARTSANAAAIEDNVVLRRKLWDATVANAKAIAEVNESTARVEGQLDGVTQILESIDRRVGH
jgi:hypothetical protein